MRGCGRCGPRRHEGGLGSQAGLLEALGDRNDVTARSAVVEMLKSEDDKVRAAADAQGIGVAEWMRRAVQNELDRKGETK